MSANSNTKKQLNLLSVGFIVSLIMRNLILIDSSDDLCFQSTNCSWIEMKSAHSKGERNYFYYFFTCTTYSCFGVSFFLMDVMDE